MFVPSVLLFPVSFGTEIETGCSPLTLTTVSSFFADFLTAFFVLLFVNFYFPP